MSGTISIRAHFDGKTIVPDEPVQLPSNTALVVDIRPDNDADSDMRTEIIARQLNGLKKLKALAKNDPIIPLDQLRRVNLYDDMER